MNADEQKLLKMAYSLAPAAIALWIIMRLCSRWMVFEQQQLVHQEFPNGQDHRVRAEGQGANPGGPGAVGYDRLRIRSDTGCHCGEEVHFLFDEAQQANNQFHTSKWNARSGGRVTLEIDVVGQPIQLTEYALKSANDAPGRDPRSWSLVAVDENHKEHVVHRMNDNNWGGRWEWKRWRVEQEVKARKFFLRIESNHGDGGCTQMGQMRLFEKVEQPIQEANANVNNEGAISYNRLRISSATPVHCREEAQYLFDDKQTGVGSQYGTSKWNAQSGGQVTLEINVIGAPIQLSHYALKSANDCPNRDPRVWKLVGVDVDHQEHVIHNMPHNDWGQRWQWLKWPVGHQFWATKFYLRIEQNHGDPHCTQMGQLRLFEKDDAPVAPAPANAPAPAGIANADSKEGAISYDRLKISSQKPVHCREEAKYLFDDKETGVDSQLGTSKWNAVSGGQVTLQIDVIGPPLSISHYALKSANDCPDRDPRAWKLIAVDLDRKEHVIHSMQFNKWPNRWQWRKWPVHQQFLANQFFLRIEENNGHLNCTQLGQMRLFEKKEEVKALPAPVDNRVAYERLQISSSTREFANERAQFLFDEKQIGVNSNSNTSKWFAPLDKNNNGVTLHITVVGQPIRLSGYALKSANDVPGRDPKIWQLLGVDEHGFQFEIHRMAEQRPKWDQRWQWKEWQLPAQTAAKEFRLVITSIQDGNKEGCQLGQIRLFEDKAGDKRLIR